MKKTLLILTAAILFHLNVMASGNDKVIKDTIINKVVYHLYQGAKGGKYIIRTSQKTGKEYKQYFKTK